MKKNEFTNIIRQALKEDKAKDDLTSQLLIDHKHTCEANIIAKQNAVICGMDVAKNVFQHLSKKINFKTLVKDGQPVTAHTVIANIKGPTRAVLAGERTALNFLSHLSGISTKTAEYVEKIQGTQASILDTRKTTPGLRHLEKYAVTCGGGGNHRFNLNDMVMIKDNHRYCYKTLDDLTEAIQLCRRKTKKRIEVEVDNLNEFKKIIEAEPDIILLDNMSLQNVQKAVEYMAGLPPSKKAILEVSGGITLKNILPYAKTGVTYISVGSLTHTHTAINFSLEIK